MDNLSSFHLSRLRAVEVLGRHRTLAGAAGELNVSPGAVSKHVIKIETQLGRRLFNRTPGGFETAPEMKDFLTSLTQGFETIDGAIRALDREDKKEIRLTVAPIFARTWMIPRLATFYREFQDLRLEIESNREVIALPSSDFSCAIRFGKGPWPETRSSKLLEQCLFPVCAPSVAERLKSPEDLAKVPVILSRDNDMDWRRWLHAADAEHVKLLIGPRLSDADLSLGAAVSGLGVALAWQTVAVDAIRAGQLVVPFPVGIRSGNAYWFLKSEIGHGSRAVDTFEKWLFRNIEGSGEAFDALPHPVGVAAGL